MSSKTEDLRDDPIASIPVKQQASKFMVVSQWRPNAGPYRRHVSEDIAIKEEQRLSNMLKREFVVVEIKREIKPRKE